MIHASTTGRLKQQRMVWCAVLLAALLLPCMAIAQGYFGTVGGELTDPSGGVVPGAKVVLTDQAKGYTFSATSDKQGRYLFTSIPPGLYSVSAEMPGFEKAVHSNVKVNISENAIANLTLRLASATESVKVEAETMALSTEDAVTGQVVNRRFINDLPLVDRYVMDLTFLAPGVTTMDDQCPNCGGTNFVSNGSRGASADILMDGASITNFEPNGGVTQATYTPSPEAVEEFKVQQTNFSAEYGFSGGSVVNMVTRSGTNNFHGSAYDFIRNQMTDANNFFLNAANIPIPPVHRNNYGGTFGGPIIKSKTFFFFDWDGTRSSSLGTYQAGVPSAAERTGDFGEVCTANGGSFDSNGVCSVAAGQIWDPYTGTFDSSAGGAVRSTPIPYNNLATYMSPGNPKLNGTPYQLPAVAGNLIDPVASKMMGLFPMPNYTSGGIYDNWVGAGASRGYNDQFDIKIDQRFGEKNLLSGKYSQQWNHGTSYNCFGNYADPCAGGPNHSSAHLFAINDTQTFSPTLVLTSTFGFTRGSMRIDAYDANSNPDPLGSLGFPSYLQTNGFLGVPPMFIGGGYYSAPGWGLSIGSNPYGNYVEGQDTGQLTFLLTKLKGRHELKFGFEGRLHQQNYIQTNAPVGYFNFDDRGTSQCPNGIEQCGGDGMASFMMGNSGGGYYQIQFEPATENYQFAWFGQDNWKVTPKLTLNLGLRYDVSLPRTERHNRMNWFDPTVTSPLNGGSLTYTDPLTGQEVTQALVGGEVFASPSMRTNWVTDWSDIQPRLGFAYSIDPKTVVRGGYGIYYSQSRSGANGLLSYGSQGFNQSTNMITTYQNDGATPYLHLSNPFPYGLILPPGNSLGLMNDVSFNAIGPIRDHFYAQTPYEQSWSFGFERQLGWSTLLSIQYIGKKGTHLYFAGTNQLSVLGPWVENLSTDQIASLNDYVQNPFYGIVTDPNSTLSSAYVPAYQLKVPYPQFTGVTTDVQPIANSIYNALQIAVEKRYSNGLQLSANYTFSKSIDDSSTYDDNVTWLGSFLSLQDPNRPKLERSLSTFDIPNVFKVNYTYDLPFGRGRAYFSDMPRVLDLIFGGWSTNGVWTVQAGRPLSFFTADGGIPIPTYGPQRPNMVGTPRQNHGADWLDNYIANPEVFTIPDPYTLGTAPRAVSSIRTPFFFTCNLSVQKIFPLSSKYESMNLELRLEAENAFNHPVFGTPNTNVGDPSFGSISYTTIGPRQVQLGLKFSF